MMGQWLLIATLTDRDTTVSMVFRFNEVGEVTGIYSPGRFGSFDGGYKRVPWEGHFRDYQVQAGMRVPLYGEVGWYDDGAPQLVWKGNIINAQYELEPWVIGIRLVKGPSPRGGQRFTRRKSYYLDRRTELLCGN